MTPHHPPFFFHISGVSGVIRSGSALWHTPLGDQENSQATQDIYPFTIGDYFECAAAFMLQDRAGALKRGLTFHLHREIPLEQVESISLFLEKHGAFYHPARVEVTVDNHPHTLLFALNAAISHRGLALMATECRCLEKLIPVPTSDSPLPAVFGHGIVPFNDGTAAFFLAHWFKGYQEFHVTGCQEETASINLWQSDGGRIKMAATHHFDIYRRASEILTFFYNPVTFEQIFPWHHAAGDFIVKEINGSLDVKLITVRGYSALFDIEKPPEKRSREDIFQGLYLFLVHLSLRMRIDRIDGTGRYHFLPPDTIKATLCGFFKALACKTMAGHTQDNLQATFGQFLLQFDCADFNHILTLVLNAHPHPELEEELIKKHLDSHAKDLYHAIWSMGKNRFFIDKTV